MTAPIPAPTLRPGDPPPFWVGYWHPEGKAEGGIMVGAGATAAPAAPAAPPAVETTIPFAAPAAEPAAAIPLGAPPAAEPAAAIPLVAPPVESPTISLGPPPAAIPLAAPPAAEAPQAPQAPRSYVASLLASGPVAAAPGLPQVADPAASQALRAKAKELQGAKQLGPALQALSEALKRSPGEAATYAQIGSVMLAGKAWEDAAHHFLLAYMLSPREATFGRMTLHAAWVLGYVGWAYQIAQALYRVQPAPDLAEMGRQAQGWLQARPPAHTSLCPACRTTAIQPAQGPCAKCGAATLGAIANPTGFQGLKLMQLGSPQGRLLAGASCVSCQQDTVLVISKGGPRCMACQGPALASL